MDIHGQATLTSDDVADAQMAMPAVTKLHRFFAFIVAAAAFQILTAPAGLPMPATFPCAVASAWPSIRFGGGCCEGAQTRPSR